MGYTRFGLIGLYGQEWSQFPVATNLTEWIGFCYVQFGNRYHPFQFIALIVCFKKQQKKCSEA
jgi:hypothetical protein